MPEIVVKIDGLDAVRERLNEVAKRMENLSPIMKAIGERITRQTWERFNAGGPAPDGSPWAKPKSPNPKRRGTLRVTDMLRDSINYRLRGSNAVEVGTNLVYAAIHQFGGRTSPRTILPSRKKALFWPGAAHPVRSVKHPGSVIPARPFLGVSADNSAELLGLIDEWIMNGRS